MATVGEAEGFPRLSQEAWDALERRVRAFEASWSSGRRPSIEACLADDDSGGRLLIELIHADLEFRSRAGESPSVREYLEQFPILSSHPHALASLADAEREFSNAGDGLSITSSRVLNRLLRDTNAGELEETSTGPARSSPGEHASLPILPGYEIIREIARGGMGVVYEAVETRLKRPVALKTVRPGADREERERLKREAEAVAALVHPHVVQVHQVLEHDSRLYVVSEYLSGGTLAEMTDGEPLDANAAARLLEPLAKAVAYAHSKGVVHRDLKPSNILLTGDRTPKVADFGLAKRADDDSALTRTGIVAGSPSYMAPEQTLGSKDVGPAADVWALGAILYELLTGRPPFRGASTLDTLELVRTSEPVPPRRLVPRLPRDLETICLKCLEKEPGSRYGSADHLADDVGRFLRGESVRAAPVSPVGRAWRWAKRNRAVAALLILLAASVVSGAGGSLWYATNAKAAAEHATKNEGVAQKNEAAALASEQYAKRLLFASDMQAVAVALGEGDPARAAELLDLHAAERDGPYAFVWNHLNRLTRPPSTIIDRWGSPAYFVCFSPDRKVLAACGATGEVRLYTTGAWTPLARWHAGQGELNGLAFSADGETLLSAGDDGTVAAWKMPERKLLWRRKVFDRQAYQVAFGLDGTLIAACGNDTDIRLLSPVNGAVIASIRADEMVVEAVAVSRDGKSLFTAGRGGRAAVWDLVTRHELWHDDSHVGYISVAVSPDLNVAAFGLRDAQVCMLNIEEKDYFHVGPLPGSRRTPDGPMYRAVAFSSDDRLAVGDDAGVVRLTGVSVDHLGSPGEQKLPIRRPVVPAWPAGKGRIASLAADDRFVVTASRDGALVAWNPYDTPAWEAAEIPGPCHAPVLVRPGGSGNPERIAVFTEEGLWLTDAAHGASEKVQPALGRPESFVGSLDGRRLYGSTADGLVVAWKLRGGSVEELWRRPLGTNRIAYIAGDGGGGRFLFSRLIHDPVPDRPSEVSVAVIDAANGKIIKERPLAKRSCEFAVALAGGAVAASQGSKILILDPVTLDTQREFDASGEVWSLACSHDGRLVAAATRDCHVTVWDTRAGSVVRTWTADTGNIISAAFSPDGRMLLTAVRDEPPRLWDIETGRLLLEPGKLPFDAMLGERFWDPVFFTSDGRRAFAGSWKLSVMLDGRPLE